MFIDGFLGGQVTRDMVGISFAVADAAQLNNITALEGVVIRFEEHLAEARLLHNSIKIITDRLRDGTEIIDVNHRTSTIDLMLTAEAAYEEGRGMLVARSIAGEASALHQPHRLSLLRRVTALIDEQLRLRAEAARDLRWALLELEAAAEPPAEGPVLAGPADLSSFLQELRTPS